MSERAPSTYWGRARYVPRDGAWNVMSLEFDPPLVLPANYAGRYKTPLMPDQAPDAPGPWFALTVTFYKVEEVT